jgi:hypothetical protein
MLQHLFCGGNETHCSALNYDHPLLKLVPPTHSQACSCRTAETDPAQMRHQSADQCLAELLLILLNTSLPLHSAAQRLQICCRKRACFLLLLHSCHGQPLLLLLLQKQ